jgi:hypothetical protein
MELVTLYRPVGQAELDLVEASGWTAFPPRLPIQPIFYPVLQLEYARQIAKEWNTKDAASGYAGHVTAFEVKAEFLSRHQIQTVGSRGQQEYWIPANEMQEFISNIVGRIRLIESYQSSAP